MNIPLQILTLSIKFARIIQRLSDDNFPSNGSPKFSGETGG
ncbi:hypothetical protein GXM_08257 [Nostoc sphaeroides CCNUC1]|uniref:Uncharacterized protein n=1 Tax=Nostoc sphaeroides CCNUC1 TaxID=2653204 RepID=A0A5P8WCX4_9NOSO|nr:hypothetical protein GXM_08005 [Nostoc sphaeroides CCNUC1]QFS50665.1 hypothetical protein GXM_08159 [Nostoc sphaeroides CCNUC1]QFS50763.1 hypothetical protein GXM_08257 [Nostoc sphaeroides CCNUC1]